VLISDLQSLTSINQKSPVLLEHISFMPSSHELFGHFDFDDVDPLQEHNRLFEEVARQGCLCYEILDDLMSFSRF